MKPRHKRFIAIAAALLALGGAVALVLNAFQSNLVFFFSPSQVASKEAPVGRSFRLGGLVQNGTVARDKDGVTVRFAVTDTAHTIPVVYRGILPDHILDRRKKGFGIPRYYLKDLGGGKTIQEHVLRSLFLTT